MNRYAFLAPGLVLTALLLGGTAFTPGPAQEQSPDAATAGAEPGGPASAPPEPSEQGAATQAPARREGAMETRGDLSQVQSIVIDRGLTALGKTCVECHKQRNPGIISDGKRSRHGHVGVT